MYSYIWILDGQDRSLNKVIIGLRRYTIYIKVIYMETFVEKIRKQTYEETIHSVKHEIV